MQVASLRYINRRENPASSGSLALPAVSINYSYRATGNEPISEQYDSLDITLTTEATAGRIGSADIDATLAIDQQIYDVLDGWTEDPHAGPWRRVAGGNVNRDTGYCQTVIRYQRSRSLPGC